MKKQGFSLIELMVVISIISILSVFAMANFGGITDKGRFAKARSQMDELKKAVTKYAISHDGNFPRNLAAMRGSDIVAVPESPWGKKYFMDDYFIICEVPSGDSSPSKYIRVPYRDPGWIYYNDGNDMKRVSPIGGKPTLMNPSTGDDPAVCNEKNFIAYTSNGIYYFDMGDSTAPVRDAVPNNSNAGEPCWAPRGNRIAYTDSDNIYVVNIKNLDSPPLNISKKLDEALSNPCFSSDGNKIIAQSSANELWVLDVNAATPPRTLVISGNGGGVDPCWSHNGNMVLFTDDNGKISTIRATDYMELRNTRKFILTSDGFQVDGESPYWSPDDSSIVYSYTGKLYVYSFKTKTVSEIIDGDKNPITGTNPVWGYR